MLLLASRGRLPLREVMEYAIGYAGDGYPVVPGISAAIGSVAGAFRQHWPTSAEIYLPGGVPAPGSRFANPVLAATYQRILTRRRRRERQRGPDRGGAAGVLRGVRGRGDRQYLERAQVMDGTGEPHRAC